MDLDQLVHGHVANRGRRRQPHHGSDSLGPHGGGAGGSSSAPTVPVAPPPPLVPHHHQHHGHHAGPPPPPPPLASWSGAGASSASAPARSKHPAASVPPPPQLPPPPPPPPPARSTSGIPSSSPSHMLPHAGPSASGPSASQGLVCDLCDRAFDSKATYDSHNAVFHRRSKTPAKPRPPAFTCPQCGKGFSSPSKVNVHIEATHLRLRPFKCDLCPKSFGYKGDLTKHKATHSGVKEHTCYICGARFARNFYVKRHILTVHEKGGEGAGHA